MWFVYLLYSARLNRFYTGISNRPAARLRAHNGGTGARATRAGRPWELVFLAAQPDHSTALRVEHQMKKDSALQKAHRTGVYRIKC